MAPDDAVNINVPKAGVSPEVEQKAKTFVENLILSLRDKTSAYAEQKAAVEAAGPVIAGYPYMDCLTVGPITFTGNPPYLPNKVVPVGSDCLMIGIIWINQTPGPAGTFPASIVLGGHELRVRFEAINLTTVSDGPDGTFSVVLDSPANEFYYFFWWMPTPDPGENPALMEVNMTADITLGGQPMAAFSTWHYDLDAEPPFADLAEQPAHWQFERPARFLIYKLS